jgi:hypothetical protein
MPSNRQPDHAIQCPNNRRRHNMNFSSMLSQHGSSLCRLTDWRIDPAHRMSLARCSGMAPNRGEQRSCMRACCAWDRVMRNASGAVLRCHVTRFQPYRAVTLAGPQLAALTHAGGPAEDLRRAAEMR